jgi:hypothetical protein
MTKPTNKTKNIKPTIEKEPNTKPTVINKSENARIMSIHFANFRGQLSESASGFAISTASNVTKKIKGTKSMFSYDSAKTAAKPTKKHTTGNITTAIPGLLKARNTQRTKINIAIIANMLYSIIILTTA